ncbi:TPA: hypothetical protein ACH3X1_008284 [Trebouxia sp. C0004]
MLDTVSGHVKLLLAAVNLHRILRTVESCLPQEVLPVDQLQVSPNQKGYICEWCSGQISACTEATTSTTNPQATGQAERLQQLCSDAL